MLLKNPFPLVPFGMLMAAGYVQFWTRQKAGRAVPSAEPQAASRTRDVATAAQPAT